MYTVDSIRYSKVCEQTGATSTEPLMLSDKLEIILLRLGELDIQVLSNSGHYIGCGNYEPKAMSIWQANVGDEVHSLLLTLIECYRQCCQLLN